MSFGLELQDNLQDNVLIDYTYIVNIYRHKISVSS